jgi:hypothetical protein
MLKRKLDPSTKDRGLSIRSCIKDLRLRRVFSLGSDSNGIESNENGGADIGSSEAGGDKDPITAIEIKDASKDCEKVNRVGDIVELFYAYSLLYSCSHPLVDFLMTSGIR